jgi:hypothetical protein
MYKGNLTKEQAYQLMIEGKKVCREGFSSKEYVCIIDGHIKDESGYYFEEWWTDIEPTMHKTDDKTFYLFKE